MSRGRGRSRRYARMLLEHGRRLRAKPNATLFVQKVRYCNKPATGLPRAPGSAYAGSAAAYRFKQVRPSPPMSIWDAYGSRLKGETSMDEHST
jgi:hypothetical protein